MKCISVKIHILWVSLCPLSTRYSLSCISWKLDFMLCLIKLIRLFCFRICSCFDFICVCLWLFWSAINHVNKQRNDVWYYFRMKRKNANCTYHVLSRNCPLKHVTEGKIEGRVEVVVRRKIRTKREDNESWKTKSTGWPSVEDSPWKRLGICRKIDYEIKERKTEERKKE
jgi:hypothetical protein